MEKEENARAVIENCKTDKGFNASTQRYHQLWLRDLVYSEDILLKLGYLQDVENHLSEFIRLQLSNGQIPTVIDYSVSKIVPQRYQRCPSDTEILFVTGMLKYAAIAGNKFLEKNKNAVKSCVELIESRLDDNGLVSGMDWRDALPVYIGKYLLANQMLLANMYELLGDSAHSNSIRESVNKLFYLENHGWYADSIHWHENDLKRQHYFDSLGNALAILNGTAQGEVAKGVLRGFGVTKTAVGYRNIVPYYEFNREKVLTTWYRDCRVPFGVFLRNRPGKYQNSAIWPFVEIRVVEALRKMQAVQEAEEATNLIISRDGFNEFYDPMTGAPEGSKGQLWTAAAVLSAVDYFRS